MFDTPGVIPIKLPEKHKHLLGVIPITKLKHPIDIAETLLTQFEEIDEGMIFGHYNLPHDKLTFLENLAKSKNKIIKGGEPDERSAAIILLRDHVRGRIPIRENISDPLRFKKD